IPTGAPGTIRENQGQPRLSTTGKLSPSKSVSIHGCASTGRPRAGICYYCVLNHTHMSRHLLPIKEQFTIQDLENLSGIKAHTIRIWEKRYNLLTPARTANNVRTY